MSKSTNKTYIFCRSQEIYPRKSVKNAIAVERRTRLFVCVSKHRIVGELAYWGREHRDKRIVGWGVGGIIALFHITL